MFEGECRRRSHSDENNDDNEDDDDDVDDEYLRQLNLNDF